MEIHPNWAGESKELLPAAITSHFDAIYDRQSWIYENATRLTDLYCGVNTKGRERYIQTIPEEMARMGTYQCKLNITGSLVDTVANRITSHPIRPWILGTGGRWEIGLKAKKLEKYVMGVFYRENYDEIASAAFIEAGYANIGYILVGFDGKDVFLERVPNNQIIVDEEMAYRGKVTEMCRVKDYLPHELKELYPDAEDIIDGLSTESMTMSNERYSDGIIRTREVWKQGSKRNPGIHCVVAGGRHLQEPEEYTKDYFPIVPVRWKERPGHWIGLGMAEEMYSLQLEIDREVSRVQRNHNLHGDPPVMNDIRAKVPDEHLEQSFTGRIVNYDGSQGKAPTHVIKPSIHSEFPAWINQCRAWANALSGVSQFSAEGQRDPGNDADAPTIRMLEGLQSKRLAKAELAWQQIGVDVCRRVIDISAEAYKGKSVKVKYVAKGFVETIDWKECADLEDDSYHLRVYPVSLYPDTPDGRIDTAERLLKAGLADPVEARAQVYGPEMERMKSYHTAPIDDINMQIDSMLYEGKFNGPTKYQDLSLGIRMVNSAYLRGRVDGVPEERLSLLLRWLDDADRILKAVKAEAEAEAAAAQQAAQPAPEQPQMGPNDPGMEQEQPDQLPEV